MTQEPKLVKLQGGRAKSESHLHSHGHLTNNIHLRNLLHMQRQRILLEARNSSELPLMKELTILRRARSLRDPSTSPAWSHSSYGSRRKHGNGKRDEPRDVKIVDSTANPRKDGGRREKLDLRVGGRHWVGEFLGGEEAASDEVSISSDQKENHVLKSNGARDHVLKGNGARDHYQTSDPRDTKTLNGPIPNKNGVSSGRRLDKSRSYPRAGEEDEEQQHRRSGKSSAQHSEKGSMAEEVGERGREAVVTVDDRLQRGSIREVEDGWVEEPERRAEIARRVISETRSNGEARADGGGGGFDTRPSSPAFALKSSTAHTHHNHHNHPGDQSDGTMSVMDLADHDSDGEEAEEVPRLQTGGGYGDSEEEDEEEVDEISLRDGLKQLPSSLSSHAQSPLLYRDSMTFTGNERMAGLGATRGRRKPSKALGGVSGSRDGMERRYRDGITVRMVGKQGRLRGRRPTVRPGLSTSTSSSAYGMAGELEVSELPRNGCGIPWYWTRMHQKYRGGRRFLDIAGRSLACGFAEGNKGRKEDKQQQQSRSNSQRDFAQVCHSLSLDKSGLYPSRRLEGDCGGCLEIPRADGNLLTADRSGELIFGSTREELSGSLVPPSPAYGDESPGLHLPGQGALESTHSLSQKYRPRSFSELVGQSMVTKSLSTAVLTNKIAPVYLFQGPSGTGKTSAARILAQALNCNVSESLELARPCGFCSACANPRQDIREFDAARINGVDNVKALLGNMLATPSTSRYRVFIIDDCHLLSGETWNTFLKALEKIPPCQVVFILVTSEADKVPRAAIARCQKFIFSKIKEVEIVSRLQALSRQEGLEVEDNALALVAARAQGSLRDAETILDQLSLLGRTVSLSMVQEMAGLISDDKLIDLLDLAMSAEAVSTVRCMRDLLDGGVEPLALVSQLAALITDILAGTYIISRDKVMRGFFFKRNSKKEEAVRLRQALKILSEAEKQLRLSSDQPTWLTAALLQFAPDRSFQPSSLDTSVAASPIAAFNDTSEKETVGDSFQPWTSEEQIQYQPETRKGELTFRGDLGYPSSFLERWKQNGAVSTYSEAKVHPAESPVISVLGSPDERVSGRPSNARSDTPLLHGNIDDLNQRDFAVMSQRKLQEVWQRVLQGSRSNVLRQLLQGQGKLLSLLLSDAFAVAHVEFRHPDHKARAERSRSRICNAFQMALGCPVELQITLACMPSEQQLSFTSVEDQPHTLDAWNKEKMKSNASAPDGRSHDTKTIQNRRRQRSTRIPRHTETLDIPQSLYNAVMGDSKSFKPEILPVVSSTRWGRHGGPPDSRHEEHSERPQEARKAPPTQELRHPATVRARHVPVHISTTAPGKVPLKTVIRQFENTVASPSSELQTDVICGPGVRRKSARARDANIVHLANSRPDNPRLDTRLKSSHSESRLLCWRVQKLDEEKIKIQRRRRHRRVTSHGGTVTGDSSKSCELTTRASTLAAEALGQRLYPLQNVENYDYSDSSG